MRSVIFVSDVSCSHWYISLRIFVLYIHEHASLLYVIKQFKREKMHTKLQISIILYHLADVLSFKIKRWISILVLIMLKDLYRNNSNC